jgi:hypothetical protein
MEQLKSASYRQLDPQKVINTIAALRARVLGRFPNSGLGNVVGELLGVAEETVARTVSINKPILALRAVSWLLIAAIVVVLCGTLVNLRGPQPFDFNSFVQVLEASLSSIVFIGAAILFLATCETRIKRARALQAIHELRALAHIVDMHQLTKDPELFLRKTPNPQPSEQRTMTAFELNRYLDYCSETLSLISKIAALYVQSLQDPVVLDAVDDVEDLTSGLSRKIWQKLTILDEVRRGLELP